VEAETTVKRSWNHPDPQFLEYEVVELLDKATTLGVYSFTGFYPNLINTFGYEITIKRVDLEREDQTIIEQ
jgi:hypothetical protein